MKLYVYGQEGWKEGQRLRQFLELRRNQWDVVSFVGGGGKTTSIYYLAKELAADTAEGDCPRVLVTTTTKMHLPETGCLLFSPTVAQAEQVFLGYSWITAGSFCGSKLGSLEESDLNALLETAQITLIEADGSKGLPCKAPAPHEPVLIDRTTKVVAMAGLACIGRPIHEVCHRPELAAKLLGVSVQAVMTPAYLARLLCDEQGQKKAVSSNQEFYVLLNQADNEERLEAGRQTAELLSRAGVRRIAAARYEIEEQFDRDKNGVRAEADRGGIK